MKIIIGILMVLGGIALGLYVGLYICLIGGILDIADVVQEMVNDESYVVEVSKIAWGVIKIIFTGFAGWLSAMVLIIPGAAMINN